LIGFFIRSFEVLSNLVNEAQLITTFRLRATVAHCALNNRIRCYPTESRTKYVDDKALPAKIGTPAGTTAAVWKKFQGSVSGSEMFFEITIS
jgi:hypothetical protein